MSVVIPTYNRARFVPEAITSVLSQQGVRVEVIVVDDGSTDNTNDVIKTFGDQVRYIQQKNAGASAARNTGIHHATAEFIAFLDSDDVFLPGKLSHQMMDLRKTGAIAHVTDVILERSFAQNVSLMDLRNMKHHFDGTQSRVFDRPLALNVAYNFARTQSILVRRSPLLAAGLYNTGYRFFEDTDLMNRLALEGPWSVSPVPFVREIRRNEEIEGLGDENRRMPHIGQQALVAQMRALLGDGRVTGAERKVLRRFLGRYAYGAGKLCLRVLDTDTAHALFREGWRGGRSWRCLAARGLAPLPRPLRRPLGF